MFSEREALMRFSVTSGSGKIGVCVSVVLTIAFIGIPLKVEACHISFFSDNIFSIARCLMSTLNFLKNSQTASTSVE